MAFYFRRTTNSNLYLSGVGTLQDPVLIAYGASGNADKQDIMDMITTSYNFMGYGTPEFVQLLNYTIISNGTSSLTLGYE